MVEIRRRSRRVKELEGEIGDLVEARAPGLLELEGCGPLTAARLIAETAGAARFASDARRCHAPAREFLARKQAEGKSRREALRCPRTRSTLRGTCRAADHRDGLT